MRAIPKDTQLDSTFSILQDGYTFIEKRSRQMHTDLFEARILGEKAVCLHGQEAAERFYDTRFFKRKGATPRRIQKTLFGEKGVQTLDGAAHSHRKSAFMSMMSRESVSEFMTLLAEQWRIALMKWEQMDEVHLFTESRNILCRVACKWAGVPLREDEVVKRAQDLSLMVDAFGGVGPRNWKCRLARSRSQDWIAGLVDQVREQQLTVPANSALQVFAFHRDTDGALLDKQVAAVEILNVIRPMVAISWFNTFLALALHLYPEYRSQLKKGNDQDLEHFVQEVRRYFPFVPYLGARAVSDFEWKGYHFKKDQLVLLDIYGTNRDDRQWERPEVFWPERFRGRALGKYGFIPQGGGDFLANHRCAGEWITIGAMKVCLNFLARHMDYRVPDQDLSYSLDRMPANPRSGFIIRQVKNIQARDTASP